jgi:hypothetical protein
MLPYRPTSHHEYLYEDLSAKGLASIHNPIKQIKMQIPHCMQESPKLGTESA